MWLKITLMTTLLLSGCNISRSFQPPPYDYETYYKIRQNDVPAELVKQDMATCGFDEANNNAGMLHRNKNRLVEAEICMEQKGYTTNSTKKEGVCGIKLYKNTEACQNHLAQ